jgi:hypothetical protein
VKASLEALSDLVVPLLRSKVRENEWDELVFEVEPSSTDPRGGLRLDLRCGHEIFRFYLIDPAAEYEESSDELSQRLERELTTFIAESSFAWGQER